MTDPKQTLSDKVAYRDSRRAAERILRPGRTHALRRFLSFVAVAGLVLYVWVSLTSGGNRLRV